MVLFFAFRKGDYMFEQAKVNSKRWFNLMPLLNEKWKPLKVLKKGKIYDYINLYEASNYGRIKSLGIYHGKTNIFFNKPHILKARKNKCGYLMYSLSHFGEKNYVTAHRIIATTFLKNKNNFNEVNHKDGNKENNNVKNLEWCTTSYNIKHAYINGLKISKGNSLPKEKNPNCKHSEKEIEEIRAKRKNGCKLKEIAKEHNISESYISNICKYKFWK